MVYKTQILKLHQDCAILFPSAVTSSRILQSVCVNHDRWSAWNNSRNQIENFPGTRYVAWMFTSRSPSDRSRTTTLPVGASWPSPRPRIAVHNQPASSNMAPRAPTENARWKRKEEVSAGLVCGTLAAGFDFPATVQLERFCIAPWPPSCARLSLPLALFLPLVVSRLPRGLRASLPPPLTYPPVYLRIFLVNADPPPFTAILPGIPSWECVCMYMCAHVPYVHRMYMHVHVPYVHCMYMYWMCNYVSTYVYCMHMYRMCNCVSTYMYCMYMCRMCACMHVRVCNVLLCALPFLFTRCVYMLAILWIL